MKVDRKQLQTQGGPASCAGIFQAAAKKPPPELDTKRQQKKRARLGASRERGAFSNNVEGRMVESIWRRYRLDWKEKTSLSSGTKAKFTFLARKKSRGR